MRIRILTSCSGVGFSYHAGDTVEASDRDAVELLRAGHAEPAGEPAAAVENAATEPAEATVASRRGRPRRVGA